MQLFSGLSIGQDQYQYFLCKGICAKNDNVFKVKA